MGVGIIKSTTEQGMAGMGLFAREQLGKRMVNGYNSGKMIYINFFGDKDVKRRNEK